MPDDVNGGQSGTDDAGGSGTDQGDQGQQGNQPGTGNDQGGTPDIQDPQAVLAALNKANAEAAKFRRDLAQAQQRIKAFEDEKLSDSQKLEQQVRELQTKLDQAESRARTQALQGEVSAVASKLGFLNPGVAHRLIDQEAIEYDDAGKPKNVEALLRDLVKAEPYLARTGSADAGSGRRSGGSGGNMNQLIRQAAGRGG